MGSAVESMQTVKTMSGPQISAGFKTKATSLTQVVQAIDTFHHLENHFAVPFGFVVPKSVDWPKELHNLPLGVKVHRLMLSIAKGRVKGFQKNPQDAQQLQELQDMGFPMHQWQEYQFQEVILPALKVYSSHYGGLFVPQKFVVPERDEAQAEGWPRASQGFKLGLTVAKLRKQMQQRSKKTESLTTDLPPIPETQVEALNEIDFVWHVRDAKWYQFFLPGLRKYRELYGNADVPLAFTIPSHEEDSRWPKVLEGYMLGRHVYMVRSGKYSSQVQDSEEELQKLGFSFRVSDKIWSENIFPALEVFVSEFGHCDVWQEFVVPPEAPWPEKAWGSKLGDTVKSIRRGAYDAQVRANHKELEGLGFVWNARHRVENTVLSVVLPALVTYQRLHGTDASVTTDFVVPERDSNWPPLSRGFKLGQWITRVRSGQVPLPSKLRKELDAIGFVWRSNDQRWNEVLLPAFRVYAELHSGTCASMSTKFYVPPEAPYPRASWGANLGGALWHIRNGDSYVNCEDKQRELRALGVLSDDDVA
ncbi:hypothetical protein BBJ29_002629 [Phytophthora kernoviae]|uniref:Helicase-associated domain-containing protein n=1 Tax=Phytophthora kernoviae TaxID=325452 RepID=A0A3F2RNW9_9STRA|nr:hypothetical protein BBJ29_002629 [Phytophthora kernoviae]RLN61396.1 hypothetical protein BBP00_00005422 [Phytophthora kernoviae]